MRVARAVAVAFVVVAIQFGCNSMSRAPGGGGVASSSAPLTAVPPPGPAAIGMTESLIANASKLEGYWPMSDHGSTMADQGNPLLNGDYEHAEDYVQGVNGALAGNPGTAVFFGGNDADAGGGEDAVRELPPHTCSSTTQRHVPRVRVRPPVCRRLIPLKPTRSRPSFLAHVHVHVHVHVRRSTWNVYVRP